VPKIDGHHAVENTSHHPIHVPAVTTTTTAPHHPIAEALVDTLATYDIAHRDISASLRDECQRKQIMGSLVQNASPFLFPCAIEYSLICAAILYLMWKNVGVSEPYRRGSSVSSTVAARRSRHHYSVDCAKANKGKSSKRAHKATCSHFLFLVCDRPLSGHFRAGADHHQSAHVLHTQRSK
jgi:Otopetrin